MWRAKRSPQRVVSKVIRTFRPRYPSARRKVSQATTTNPRPQNTSTILASRLTRLRSQTANIMAITAARLVMKMDNTYSIHFSFNYSCAHQPLCEYSARTERVLNRLSRTLLNNCRQNIFMNAATDWISQGYDESCNITKRRHQGVENPESELHLL